MLGNNWLLTFSKRHQRKKMQWKWIQLTSRYASICIAIPPEVLNLFVQTSIDGKYDKNFQVHKSQKLTVISKQHPYLSPCLTDKVSEVLDTQEKMDGISPPSKEQYPVMLLRGWKRSPISQSWKMMTCWRIAYPTGLRCLWKSHMEYGNWPRTAINTMESINNIQQATATNPSTLMEPLEDENEHPRTLASSLERTKHSLKQLLPALTWFSTLRYPQWWTEWDVRDGQWC